MITFEQAQQIALVHIKPMAVHWRKLIPEDDLVIEHVVEFDNCWLFHINSKLYLETRNIRYCPIGGGPVLVGKENGDIYQAGSGGNEEEWMNEFREFVRNKRANQSLSSAH